MYIIAVTIAQQKEEKDENEEPLEKNFLINFDILQRSINYKSKYHSSNILSKLNLFIHHEKPLKNFFKWIASQCNFKEKYIFQSNPFFQYGIDELSITVIARYSIFYDDIILIDKKVLIKNLNETHDIERINYSLEQLINQKMDIISFERLFGNNSINDAIVKQNGENVYSISKKIVHNIDDSFKIIIYIKNNTIFFSTIGMNDKYKYAINKFFYDPLCVFFNNLCYETISDIV